MKRPLLALALLPLALSLVAAPVAARDHDRDRDGRRDYREWRDDRGWHRGPPPKKVKYVREREVVYRPVYPPVVERVVYRPAPAPRWVMGVPYNRYYAGPVYVVNDYSLYPVRRPPPGYHWVRASNGDLLLVAITTGIIADILLHH